MLARLSVLVVFGILVFSLLMVGGSRGATQSVGVIVLVDPAGALFGDRIKVTALIFDAATAVEPSSISAVVDKLPGVHPLALVRQSVGVFSGDFVFESHPSVVRVNATVGGMSGSGAAIVFNRGPSVRVVPSKGTAAPGERISVRVEVRDAKGSFQDADSLDLMAQIGGAPEFQYSFPGANLSWTRIALGRYSAEYQVPLNIVRDSVVGFWASVSTATGGSGFGANVYVTFPDPFLVWYRTIAIGTSNATLELDVASSVGVPLSNVTVSLTSDAIGSAVMREGVTGPAGAIRFDIPVASVPATFYGNATLGLKRQSFRGFLGLPPASPVGPQLLRENPGEAFEAGQTAVLRFRLVRDGIPVPDQEMFAYAQTAAKLLLAKRLTTDGEGRFEIRFVAPLESVRLDVNGNITGTWEDFHPTFFASSRIDTSVSGADGWNFTISGWFPKSAGPWQAHLSLATVETTLPNRWTAGGPFGPERIAGGSAGSSFSFEVSLPRFLPAGSVVSASITAESFEGGYGESHLTFVAGTPVQRPVDVGVLMILSGFGLIVAWAAFGWRFRRPPGRSI